jgi:hypothetical protein
MLVVLTSIVLAVGSTQATMVLPEQERLAAEEIREPLVRPPIAPKSVVVLRAKGGQLLLEP